MEPTRNSGSWLDGVEDCPQRAVPCGNPRDADEAMRAGQIEAAGTNFISAVAVETAIQNAHKIARRCNVAAGLCPLEIRFGCNRHEALDLLKNIVK